MENTISINTGNAIVDAVGKINFSGNVIPEAWYHTIVNDNDKVNLLAINILSDIVYWYRPTEVRDELTGCVSFVKKFHDEELLQRSYEQLSQKFNISTKQAREAIIVLEQLGVVKRVFRTVKTAMGTYPNVMFLELYPVALLNLTYPKNTEDVSNSGNTSEKENPTLQEGKGIFTKKETYPSENVKTNTKTTTEIKTEISTTTMAAEETSAETMPSDNNSVDENTDVVVQKTKELFGEYNFSDDDINALVKEAKSNYDKIYNAYLCLKQSHSRITNVVGWLIHNIRAGILPRYTPDQEAKSAQQNFKNFNQREYDFSALEKKLLGYT